MNIVGLTNSNKLTANDIYDLNLGKTQDVINGELSIEDVSSEILATKTSVIASFNSNAQLFYYINFKGFKFLYINISFYCSEAFSANVSKTLFTLPSKYKVSKNTHIMGYVSTNEAVGWIRNNSTVDLAFRSSIAVTTSAECGLSGLLPLFN